MSDPAARVRGKYAVEIGGKHVAPSVTTISGMLNKPGLPWGAAKETALFAIHHKEEWIDLSNDDAYHRLRKHHRGVWDDKANRGTLVHDLAAQWAAGKEIDCPPDCAGYLDALELFYEIEQPEWLHVERSVVSATPGFEYGGSLDAVARIKGRTGIVDLKSGGRYPIETTLQLAGYRFADGFGIYDALGTLTGIEPLPEFDFAAILYLHDDGTYEFLEVPADKKAYGAFMSLRAAWGWLKEMEKWERANPEKRVEREKASA